MRLPLFGENQYIYVKTYCAEILLIWLFVYLVISWVVAQLPLICLK